MIIASNYKINYYRNKKAADMFLQAAEDVVNCLQDGYLGYYSDLHNEVFNTDYYCIGEYEARDELTDFDVFDAIVAVQDYEMSQFGERYTDVSDPVKLLNMLYYIIGDDLIAELYRCPEFEKNWNGEADAETNAAIVEWIDENLKPLEVGLTKKEINEIWDQIFEAEAEEC